MDRRNAIHAIAGLLCSAAMNKTLAADKPYQMHGVMLLQPESVLASRVPDVASFADYLKGVGAGAERVASRFANQTKRSGYIVVAVKPNRRSHIWLDFSPPLEQSEAASMQEATSSVPALDVQGIVVAAIQVGLFGGSPPTKAPYPAEWKVKAESIGKPLEISHLVELVWSN